MKAISSLLLICFVNLLLACSTFPDSSKELEARAEYGKLIPPVSKSEMPRRKKQRIEKVYMGGRMLPSGDWFAGGRLLLVVSEPDWIFDDSTLKKIEE